MSSLRANSCLKAIDEVLVEYGVSYTVEMGGKHPRAVITGADGCPYRIGFSGSVRDSFAPRKAAADARRVLREAFPALFGTQIKESEMSIQSLRSNAVYRVAKAELDEAGIPFTISTGRKHPALLFEIDGTRRTFTMPTRPHEGGTAIENYRHQVRRIIRGEECTQNDEADAENAVETETEIEIVGSPTLGPSDLTMIDGTPRVEDLVLAERLGFSKVYNIRPTIERNLEELQGLGTVLHMQSTNSNQNAKSYWLNADQAIRLCMFAKTDRAKAMRDVIQAAFKSYVQMHAPVPEISAPEQSAATLPVVSTPAVPELLANDTAIELITDLVGMKIEAAIEGIARRAIETALPQIIEATMKPLLRQQMRFGVRQRQKLERSIHVNDAAMSTVIQAQSEAASSLGDLVSAAREDILACVIHEARQRETVHVSVTRSPWTPPTVQEGRHDFEAANPTHKVAIEIEPQREVVQKSVTTEIPDVLPHYRIGSPDEPHACILDVYEWSGVREKSLRTRSFGQLVRQSVGRHVGAPVYVASLPNSGSSYNFYRRSDLRRWYDEHGRHLVRRYLYPHAVAAE